MTWLIVSISDIDLGILGHRHENFLCNNMDNMCVDVDILSTSSHKNFGKGVILLFLQIEIVHVGPKFIQVRPKIFQVSNSIFMSANNYPTINL